MTRHKHLNTVLLAEDDTEVREYISCLLAKNGLTVLEASNGQEAIDIYNDKEVEIDVILSDMRMPIKDGRDLAQYNYEKHFLPFVIYTAFADAKSALELLHLGVYDYLTKPVRERTLIGVLKNAAFRRLLSDEIPVDKNPYAGNVGELIVPSQLEGVQRASIWIKNHLVYNYQKKLNIDNFIVYINELLLNAHEHGNLRLTEEKKSELINANEYDSHLEELEKTAEGKIEVSISILKNQVAICISDGGKGFDYQKYLNMSEDEIIDRIELPNGRGILMARNFFDSLTYTNGGSKIMVTKTITS